MIHCNRIYVSEGIVINKASASKECNICHYWYFLDKVFKFHLHFCNRCHDVLMMSMFLSNITVLGIRNVDYCCIINGISKYEAINLLQKADLSEKKETL